jgi:predicted SAM-dependent methyltransferase
MSTINNSKYVQYGCGRCAPPHWRNFDASMTLWYERIPVLGKLYTKNDVRFPENVAYGDIIKGLPVADNSCHAVYCSHVLEHMSLGECQQALRNTFRMIESGGTFRFVLPDLEYYIQQYNQDSSPEASKNLMKITQLGFERKPRSFKSFLYEWLRTSAHLWMWDYKSMEQELKNVGFVAVRRAQFNDSQDEAFLAVEAKNRWDNCLGMECRKP